MIEEKLLGKITVAEFGLCEDRPFLIGLFLSMRFNNGTSGTSTDILTNMSRICEYVGEDREVRIAETLGRIASLLKEAKVNHVSELVGIPVEATFRNLNLISFRIITEVL